MIKKNILQIGLLLICMFPLCLWADEVNNPNFASPPSEHGTYIINHFTEEEGFSQSLVMNIIQDSTGYIWLASWEGLIRYDGYRFKTYKARPGDQCPLKTNRIDDLWETSKGEILCKSNGEFFLFSPQTEKFTCTDGKEISPASSFHADKETETWIKSLPEYCDINTRILQIDRQGGIWIASSRGLDRLIPTRKPKAPIMLGTQREEVIRALYEDQQHRLWIADKHGYVRILQPQQTNQPPLYLSPTGQLSLVPIAFGHNVYTILEDSKNDIWLGCKPGGIYRLHPVNGKEFQLSHFTHQPTDRYSLSNENVYSIVEDNQGQLWIGTYGGGINLMHTHNDGTIRFIHTWNHLKNYPPTAQLVYSLYAHSKGILFIGTNNGLYSCKSTDTEFFEALSFQSFQREPGEQSLSNNWITDMIPDKQEDLFIATYGGGINHLTIDKDGNPSFTNYTTEDGLVSDVIIALSRDKEDHIWCASEAALSRFNPHTQTFTNYMQGFFAEGFSFVESGLTTLRNNALIAATTQGILTLHPKEIEKSHFVPHIAFDCPETIHLSPEERTLTLSFAALDYNKYEMLQYAYRLEGSQEWNYTTENRIHLSNIPAGTSTLHLRSTNGDGVWVDNERTITIHRTPYFNERPIAWMLYGGLLLLAIGLECKTIRYIRHLKKELNNIRLTTGETIEYLTTRLQESLSIKETTKVAPSAPTELPETNDEQFCKRVETFISQHMNNADLDIEDFAREIGVSRSVLYLQMKRLFGCTPNNYLCEVRMKRAKYLMDNGHTNISDIAYHCGYSDPKYFSRCFKKIVGQTPSEYIKETSKQQ